ncbi:MAG: penicillin-binding protein [Mogibacterium sp.]|nr:penicillin-binding protein [Mogibacterium sp.]MBR2539768.1 penicillin-binding protein [Mogibacterium sp.]
MRKQERRAWLCLSLALLLFVGICIFGVRFVRDGGKWASFYGNTQIYTDGLINRGTFTDRYDEVLMECTDEGVVYNGNSSIRKATVHAVGDPEGNIASGAISIYRSQLIGYDLLNGTYDTSKAGKKVKLTIDAEANEAAYYALGGRTGAVGVYNWKTGEILCMVSTPSFDPAGYLPADDDSSYYFNNFIDGAMTPGSTFKLVTSAAVIETLSNRDSYSFECDGVNEYEGTEFNDISGHGTVNFRDALAVSCNGAFGDLTRKVGAKALEEYTRKAGLMEPLKFDGITTASGSFSFPSDDNIKLSWAGIGQADDLVNPCEMMVYMGAIANGGEAVQPTLIKSATFIKELTGGKSLGRYLDEDTANELRSMMKNNVVENYGEDNFYGFDIYAKTGTAQTGSWNPDAWFVGFTDGEESPYAFVVWIKEGGHGADAAAPVVRTVLNQLEADKEYSE